MPIPPKNILVIDVGGTHIKVFVTGQKAPVKITSGPKMTAKKMVKKVLEATKGWNYSVVSIGYPAPVIHGHPFCEPHNLGGGWVGFDFRKVFGKPVKMTTAKPLRCAIYTRKSTQHNLDFNSLAARAVQA